jgi:uncharacterized membrane protein
MPVRATGTGKLLRAWSAAIENRAALDRPANLLGAAADLLTKSPPFCRALRGEWLGHALHPLMTDFPLGAWMSASLLDLFGPPQSREASARLLTFGCLAALPTAASGVADLAGAEAASRRVGALHAAINSSALLLYGSSLLARNRGRYRVGVALGIIGGLTATTGGYLGGHLSLVRGMGVENRCQDHL